MLTLVLALLLAGAAARAAIGGRCPIPAVFPAGCLQPTTATAPHPGGGRGLRGPDRDPAFQVSAFPRLTFACVVKMLPTYLLRWGAFTPALRCLGHLSLARLGMTRHRSVSTATWYWLSTAGVKAARKAECSRVCTIT